MILLIVMQPFSWFQYLWTKNKGIEEPRNKYLRWVYDISAKIIRSAYLRTVMYLSISIGLAATSVVNVIGCSEVQVEASMTVLSNCVSSWVKIFQNRIVHPVELIVNLMYVAISFSTLLNVGA